MSWPPGPRPTADGRSSSDLLLDDRDSAHIDGPLCCRRVAGDGASPAKDRLYRPEARAGILCLPDTHRARLAASAETRPGSWRSRRPSSWRSLSGCGCTSSGAALGDLGGPVPDYYRGQAGTVGLLKNPRSPGRALCSLIPMMEKSHLSGHCEPARRRAWQSRCFSPAFSTPPPVAYSLACSSFISNGLPLCGLALMAVQPPIQRAEQQSFFVVLSGGSAAQDCEHVQFVRSVRPVQVLDENLDKHRLWRRLGGHAETLRIGQTDRRAVSRGSSRTGLKSINDYCRRPGRRQDFTEKRSGEKT